MTEVYEAPKPSSKSFGIRGLLYATSLLASGMALSLDALTLFTSISILIGWAILFSRPVTFQRAMWIFWGLLLVLFVSTLVVEVQRGPLRFHAERTHRMNEMQQVMLALLNYESAHGHFPADTTVATPEGETLRHSWRVELLPFLAMSGRQQIRYNYNEAWDGPNNRRLIPYGSPAFCGVSSEEPLTTIKLVSGLGTTHEDGKQVAFSDIEDGLSNTIALVEDFSNPINWMEPGDVSVEQAIELFNDINRVNCPRMRENAFGRILEGIVFVRLNGETGQRPAASIETTTAAAFLIADGESYGDLESGDLIIEKKPMGYFIFYVHLAIIVLPAFVFSARFFKRDEK